MTEQHKHVEAESEKLTDGGFVAEVVRPDPAADSDAASAGGVSVDAGSPPAGEARQ